MSGRLLDPSAHPKKEVREVLARLAEDGWTIREAGHWGRLYCPCQPPCTVITVAGTPQNPGNAARRLTRESSRCPLPEDDPRRPPGTVGV